MSGIRDLGVEMKADEVSTVLIGDEPALFEAVRVALGRCAADGNQVNMQATFSGGCPGETDLVEPLRLIDDKAISLRDENVDGWIEDAFLISDRRVVAQFAIYPLGTEDHMSII